MPTPRSSRRALLLQALPALLLASLFLGAGEDDDVTAAAVTTTPAPASDPTMAP